MIKSDHPIFGNQNKLKCSHYHLFFKNKRIEQAIYPAKKNTIGSYNGNLQNW